MKKIIIVVFIAILITGITSLYIVTHSNYVKLKQNNSSIKNEIKNIDEKKQTESNLNTTLKDDLTNLEKKLNKEVERYNLWKKTKEKLSSVTS